MSKPRPTMRDVANLAGVTQPTVSYVINGTANISEEVKEKVYRAIRELHYEPNYNARVLKTNKSSMIGIIIPDISNEYYAKMVNLVEAELTRQNYTIMISSTNYDEETESSCVRQMLLYNVDGIIVMYQLLNRNCWKLLQESGRKVAVLEGGNVCRNLPCIDVDDHLGGYIAARHLIMQGRKRIVYVGQNVKMEALTARYQGYVDAMKEAGLFQKALVYETAGPGDKWKEGVAIGQRLLAQEIDGMIVSSDIVAVGILKVLLQAGKKIPEEIALVGYDDIPLAELFVPALTSVAQPMEEMCAFAVEQMLKSNSGKKEATKRTLTPKLKIRDTA